MNDIEYNLFAYTDRIQKGSLLNLHDEKVKAEDFFLRIFKEVYGFKELVNLNYEKPNSKGIDLIDRTEKIGIQITAIQSGELKKINQTTNLTLNNWKDKGLKRLWIFFIIETNYLKEIDTSLTEEVDGLKIQIKTIKNLIGDINLLHKEQRLKLAELIKQEVSEEFHGLSKLVIIKEIKKGQKFSATNYFNTGELIFFSKKELASINNISINFSDNKLKDYCILGNPCSGKTTLAFAIIQKTNNNRFFYLNLTEPILDESKVIEELIQISFCHSLIIIDNIHDNINLYLKLRERILEHNWVKALYLSRYYKTFDEFDENNIYTKIKGIKYYRIDTNEDFEEKVEGIISNKIKQLKINNSSLNWVKGNFQQILNNTNYNLLKLNIALKQWERKNNANNEISFDKINQNRILEGFYDEHNLNILKNDILYTYCLLNKNDIPFIILKGYKEFNDTLRTKGIILKYASSDFFFFPHKEYARLIYDSCAFIDNDLDTNKKSNLIIDYILRFNTEEYRLDIITLLIKFYYSDDSEVVLQIINNKKINEIVNLSLSTNDFQFYEINSFLSILFNLSEQIDRQYLFEYLSLVIKYYSKHKLDLYLYEHYMIYSRMLQITNLLSIELPIHSISNALRKNEYANTNSIVELTLRISKKKRSPETVYRILNSFQFPEWLEMIIGLSTFSNITNSLSELNTSGESKRLLYGLMSQIDWEKMFEKAKRQKIDQIAKSLRELQIIDFSVGTNSCKFIFDKLIVSSTITDKLKTASLSQYSKALSDLSNISLEIARSILSNDLDNGLFIHKLNTEDSLSNFTARVLELKRIAINLDYFFDKVNEVVSSQEFIAKIEREKNINYLLIFHEFAKENLIRKNPQIIRNTIFEIKKVISNDSQLLDLITNPKILNITGIDSIIMDSISPSIIENYFKNHKITNAENIFLVLSRISKSKTIKVFNQINNENIITPLSHPELNFSQALETLNKIKNKVYNDVTLNCNKKINQILDEYISRYIKHSSSYYKLSLSDFFKAFYFGYKINSEIIEKHCKADFLNKLNCNTHRGYEISSLFQNTRRISEVTKGEFDKEIQMFLFLNTENFLNTIQNEEITKSLSGLAELHLSEFSVFADELLFKAKQTILQKANQLRGEVIFKVKIIPDIEKIAINKAKVILKELNNH